MRIQHNIMAMNAYRNLSNNNSALSSNLEKLSSGYRINRAGDDAAGLAISEKMRAQITGLDVAQDNAQSGINLVQTAEGALTEVHDMLNRMYELAEQSANGTYDENDRAQLQKEVANLKTEIDRIADSSNFNGINLLDGMGGAGQLSKLPIEYGNISTMQGVTVDGVNDGKGTQGEFTIDLSQKFSHGDTISITYTDNGGTQTTVNKVMGTNFVGATAEEQAKNLSNALQADLGAYFDIKTDGSKLILTAKVEGTDGAATIDSVTSTNADVAFTPTNGTTAADGTGNKYVGAFEVLGGVGSGTSGNIEEGDLLTFTFKDANGNTLEVEIKATGDMASSNAETATSALVDALNKATFKDRTDTTGVDESLIKVSDLFAFTANKDGNNATLNGSIKVDSKTQASAAGGNSAVSFTINRNGAKTTFNAVQKTASTATGAAKDAWTVGTLTQNFTEGDKVKIEGTLADGRTFEILLEAGKDFEVTDDNQPADKNTTMKNIGEALKSKDLSVTLKNEKGEVVGTMTGDDLFGDKGEFKVDTGTAGQFSITSNSAGKTGHSASVVTAVSVEALDEADPSLSKVSAVAQSAAESKFTLDDTLEYGAAIKVGDKTYEIVADARDTSNRNNTAVVVTDPTDSKAVAKALADAIANNEKDYNVTYENGTVTVSSKEIGSAQKALKVEMPYGDKVKTATFEFDPKQVKENSILNFNGNTYEFISKGGQVSKEGNIAIEIDDFSKMTEKSLADAFANVVKDGVATVDENGVITLKGTENADGTLTDPKVTFENSLILQIGDTADDYNQLKVELTDCHAEAMGLSGIDITSQTGSADAMAKIKDAINYVSDVRGTLGATQNRLDHTINNLSVMEENIQDAEANIRDTDVAEEMMNYTKNNILIQSAQAMLAQANQVPQGVLQLLG